MMPAWLERLISLVRRLFARRVPPVPPKPPPPPPESKSPERWDKWPPATLTLYRMSGTANDHTFGRFETTDKRQLCVTLEEPWRDLDHDGASDRNISRIPAGRYPMFLRKSHLNGGNGKRNYDVPQLGNVPKRSDVQIHIGNTLDDTEGCILVGMRYGRFHGDAAVLGSEAAHNEVMKYLLSVEEPWTLEVIDA